MSYLLRYINSNLNEKMQMIQALRKLHKKNKNINRVELLIRCKKKNKITPENPEGIYFKLFVKIGKSFKHNENYRKKYLYWNKKCYGCIKTDGYLKSNEYYVLSFILYNNEIIRKYRNSIHEQDLNYSKNVFLANVSHEIRTPLNSILGNLDCLQELKLSEHSRETLDIIQNSSYNLLFLVNDILDISGLESGKLSLHFSPENIQEILDSSYSVAKTHKSKFVDFSREIAMEIPKLAVIDAQRVKQILVNLLSNAFKYTKQGHVKLSVSLPTSKELQNLDLPSIKTIHLTPNKSTRYFYRNNSLDYSKKGERLYVKFQVEDTGTGIKAEDMRKLFERFSQIQSPRKYNDQSTGLGLVISQGLCELMQGNIGFTSAWQQGSKFYFIIPVDEYNEPRAVINMKTLKNKKVLIVDDKVENIIVLSKMLDNYNIRYTSCVSAQHAIMSYLNNPKYEFDIGLIDILMPKMDGNALANYIHKSNINLPLITLSSTNNTNISEYFTSVLHKPYSESDLMQVIYHILQNSNDAITDSSDSEKNLNNIEILTGETSELQLKETPPGTPLSSSCADVMENNLEIEILIVEDNYYNQLTMKNLLNCLGYFNITTASNGEHALEIISEKQEKTQTLAFDIIFMDIILPGINGIETTEKIMNITPCNKKPEIIAVSASTDVQEKINTTIYINKVINKPIRKNELYEHIIHVKKQT